VLCFSKELIFLKKQRVDDVGWGVIGKNFLLKDNLKKIPLLQPFAFGFQHLKNTCHSFFAISASILPLIFLKTKLNGKPMKFKDFNG
jgi:hypothetical protein